MKLKLMFFLLAFISVVSLSQAQRPPRDFDGHGRHGHKHGHGGHHGDRRERVEALRTAYITRHLNLTPTEAQQFWPLYNEFQTKEDSMENAIGDTKFNRMETMSDKELEVLIENRFKSEDARLKLRREYYEKLKKVLPIRKIALLQRTERDFRRELVEMLRG